MKSSFRWGVDAGLETFVTLSTGEKVAPPRFYRKAEAKLKKANRRLSRARAGSRRREKAKARVARLHARTARKRADWLHKLSARLVCEHDTLCIEDLCIKGLTKTKLAKSFHDAALSEFLRQIQYKAAWHGVQVVKVGRFFPSSKTCADCGHRQALTLSERRWACAGCGSRHDRDGNAARNILAEGLRIVAVRDTETRNAQGACVRPATAGDGRRTEKPC